MATATARGGTMSGARIFPVSALILAGGRSTRMGRDKALLPHPEQREITFVVHLIVQLSRYCQEVLLVARNAEQAQEYAPHVSVPIITDLTPDIGPLMGIYSGLRAIHTSHALVTAVDMPFIQPQMIAFLLSQPRDESLIVPIVNDNPQVLFAVYPRAVLPIMAERLQAGLRGPRALLSAVPVRTIAEEQLRRVDPQLRSFVNINTPEAYRQTDQDKDM